MEVLATIERNGIYISAFDPGLLGFYVSMQGQSFLKKDYSEALTDTDADLVLDGPMYGDPPTNPLLRDFYTDGSIWRGRERNGIAISVMRDGSVRWSGSVDQSAVVSVMLYPPMVRNGRNVTDSGLNTSRVWRAGIGQLADGRLAFFAAVGSMSSIADKLIRYGFVNAGYTDGGGSAKIAGPNGLVVGDRENRRVSSWFYVRKEKMSALIPMFLFAVAGGIFYFTVRTR